MSASGDVIFDIFIFKAKIHNWLKKLRAILQESEAKLEMKIFNPSSFFVWR